MLNPANSASEKHTTLTTAGQDGNGFRQTGRSEDPDQLCWNAHTVSKIVNVQCKKILYTLHGWLRSYEPQKDWATSKTPDWHAVCLQGCNIFQTFLQFSNYITWIHQHQLPGSQHPLYCVQGVHRLYEMRNTMSVSVQIHECNDLPSWSLNVYMTLHL